MTKRPLIDSEQHQAFLLATLESDEHDTIVYVAGRIVRNISKKKTYYPKEEKEYENKQIDIMKEFFTRIRHKNNIVIFSKGKQGYGQSYSGHKLIEFMNNNNILETSKSQEDTKGDNSPSSI